MDYTKVPRSLIYKDREGLDNFPVDAKFDYPQMEADFFEALEERPFIVNDDDAPELVLKIFNNARYITTLIMSENHPHLYLRRYFKIAAEGINNKTITNHVMPATMALVKNYLCHYRKFYYTKITDAIIKNFNSKAWSVDCPEGKDDFFKLIINGFSDHPLWLTDGEFKRRDIRDVIADMDVYGPDLAKGIDYVIGEIYGTLEDKDIPQTLEKVKARFDVLKDYHSHDFYYNRDMDYPISKLKKAFSHSGLIWDKDIARTTSIEESQKIHIELLEASIEEKREENKELKEQIAQLQSTDYEKECEALRKEIESLREELADLETREGIDAPKAALLVRIACTKLGGMPPNRENAWPLLYNLWGVKESNARKRLKEGVKETTVEALAKLFDDVSPMIARIIREEGKKIIDNQKKS